MIGKKKEQIGKTKEILCLNCDGTGKDFDTNETCKECNGTGKMIATITKG